MTTDELIRYYQDLLIVQYEAQPRARATIAAFIEQYIADQLIAKVRDGFNLSSIPNDQIGSAVGPQLETLALYRGLTRLVYGLARAVPAFTMPVYGGDGADTAYGMPYYGTSPINQIWYTYDFANQALYALTDAELLRLLQFRARLHSMSLTMGNVDQLLFDFFGGTVGVVETAPMQITYEILASVTDAFFGIAQQTKSLPRPAGVQLQTATVPAFTYYGFQIYGVAIDPDFAGFGLYGSPIGGSFLRYS